jgi:hypothetical protein
MNQNRCIFWPNGDVLQMSIWYLGGGRRNSNLANITVFRLPSGHPGPGHHYGVKLL